MTGRERLDAILHKRRKDRITWTTLVDDATLSLCPEELRRRGSLGFYREMGCDILLLNGWGTGLDEPSTPRLEWGAGVVEESLQEGDLLTTQWKTPWGRLTSVLRHGHPVKYPVTSLQDVRTARRMWEQARYVAGSEAGTHAAIDAALGDDGLSCRFWGPSTIPQLLEATMGLEPFYYLRHDHPQEMDDLIAVMHEKELAAFRALAEDPWDVGILCENTSTGYISPEIYERYNMPHQRDYVDIMHRRGKVAILHMCGHVRGILRLIRETRCDGIHALTPAPTGDCPWEAALDELGDDLVIIGILDPSIFIVGPVGRIGLELSARITPRIREANFILWPAADGIAVPPERFRAVQRWFAENIE